MKFTTALLKISVLSLLIFGCDKNSSFQASDSVAPKKTITVEFPANKETAVKNRGGYKAYIGTTAGFPIESALKFVDIPGSSVLDGKIQISIPDITAGTYYLKIQAYSDLINPSSGSSAASLFSDEVSFHVE